MNSKIVSLMIVGVLAIILGTEGYVVIDSNPGRNDYVIINKCTMQLGQCDSQLPRIFYDSVTKKCEELSWGGCAADDLRFTSLAECHELCEPKVVVADRCTRQFGQCDSQLPRIVYDSVTKKCVESSWGGCAADDLRFTSLEECHQLCEPKVAEGTQDYVIIDKCTMQLGECDSQLPRIFYDSVTKKCSESSWGGCAADELRFTSLEECHQLCEPKVPVADRCTRQFGQCNSQLPRIVYDSVTKKCVESSWGGCAADDLRFTSLEECHQLCEPKVAEGTQDYVIIDKCTMQLGECDSQLPRIVYDKVTKECVEFAWGGCAADDLRFTSLEECHQLCEKK